MDSGGRKSSKSDEVAIRIGYQELVNRAVARARSIGLLVEFQEEGVAALNDPRMDSLNVLYLDLEVHASAKGFFQIGRTPLPSSELFGGCAFREEVCSSMRCAAPRLSEANNASGRSYWIRKPRRST